LEFHDQTTFWNLHCEETQYSLGWPGGI